MTEEVPRGTTIRRFVVLGRIGAGAMGVVYAAYDYTLERKLALKLVRGERVLEEAQALAKLSHRNVVAIYDVGTYGDRVYIAMEHAAGGTLRDWLAKPRPVAEVLAVLREAGAGLAAAHAAKLVHGDFKPENVLLDGTGRCLVADFGLAQHAGGETRGATPAYAAPERGATPASDQFSFCVTAYEALYGQRPFVADDPARGLAPVTRKVPTAIRAALLRGLAVAPEARWPAMDDLLRVLGTTQRTRQRALLASAVLAAAAAGVVATVLVRGTPEPSCTGGEDQVVAVWSPARRAALQARLPAATFARVAGVLDRYAQDWSAMRLGACRATRVDGTQSEGLLDLRIECLRRRLGEVDAELAALAGLPAADAAARAIDASRALTPLATCADAVALQAPAPLPADPAARVQIAALADRYNQAKALYDTGRERDALAATRGLAIDTTRVGYRPLEAEVLYLRARLEYQADQMDAAEHTLLDAIAAAQAGNDRGALARSWLELIWVVGELRGRHDEAERLGVMARGAIEQAGSPAGLTGALEDRLGCIAFDRGDFALAKQRLEHGLALREAAFGNSDTEVAASLQHLALLRGHDGDEAGAIALEQRAVAIYEHELGPDHAITGQVINSLAAAQYEHGDLDGALASWRRALAIAEHTHGPHAFDTATVRTSIALGLRDKGETAEALAQSTQALEDFLAINGEDHPDAAGYVINRAYILMASRQYPAAETEMVRAEAMLERRLGADAVEVARAWDGLGKVRYAAGNPAGAALAFERSLALRETHHAPNDELAAARIELAEALMKSGRDPARARKLAAEARETADAKWRARADALLAAK